MYSVSILIHEYVAVHITCDRPRTLLHTWRRRSQRNKGEILIDRVYPSHHLLYDSTHNFREVRDRDEINDFLRSEIRLGDLRAKVAKEITETPVESNEKKVDVLLQREQTIQELQRLLEEASNDRDTARSRVE